MRGRGRGRPPSPHQTNIIRRGVPPPVVSAPGAKPTVFTLGQAGASTPLTTLPGGATAGGNRIVVLKSGAGGLQARA